MTIPVATFWWTWLIVAALLGVFVYLDYKSRPRALRPVRIAAIVLGLASLLGLYLNPSMQKEASSSNVILQTAGSKNQTVDSLIQLGFEVAKSVEEYQEAGKSSTIDRLLVAGDGLELWELEKIIHPFELLSAKPETEGPFELGSGVGVVQSEMQIKFRVFLRDSLQLNLSGPGIETSSKSATPNEEQVVFSVVPSIAGYLTYQLDGIRGGDTIFSEVVPIKVLERSKTNVLMLGVAPSFEYRFLKNYLAEEGFGVAERIQISKDVYRNSFTNLKRRSLQRLTASTLAEFQLIVLDASSYNTLGTREKNNLKEKLRIGELGLIWSSNEAANDLVSTRGTPEGSLAVTSGANTIELKTATERLAKTDKNVLFQNETIGEVLRLGLGNIVLPGVTNSYSLVLKGEEDVYSQMWQRILQPAIGSEWNLSQLSTPTFPRVNEPMKLEIIGLPSDQLVIDSVRLAISERWYQPSSWTSTYWPKRKGWNSVQDDSLKFYVFDSSDWVIQKKRSKQQRTVMHGKRLEETKNQDKQIDQPISKWVFFIAFILSFGFLWLEQRFK